MPLLSPLNPALPPWPQARVWIIGASSGIGAATAHALLAAGARVAISARREDALREIAAAGYGDRALVLPLDITDTAGLQAAQRRVWEAFGGCDLVLIVAGTHEPVRAWTLDIGRARALLAVNLEGPIAVAATVVPALLNQGRGTIALMSSVAGYRGLPKALIYGASKAALINFAETLYLDLHPRGLGVCVVNPGFVQTPLTDRNDFRMPAMISAEEAARRVLQGLRSGAFEIHFPRRFTWALKVLRVLPYRLYFAVVRRVTGT